MSPAEWTALVVVAVKALSPGVYPPIKTKVEPLFFEMPTHIKGGPTLAFVTPSDFGTFTVFYDLDWAKKGFPGGEKVAIHEACHIVFDDLQRSPMEREDRAIACAERWRFRKRKK